MVRQYPGCRECGGSGLSLRAARDAHEGEQQREYCARCAEYDGLHECVSCSDEYWRDDVPLTPAEYLCIAVEAQDWEEDALEQLTRRLLNVCRLPDAPQLLCNHSDCYELNTTFKR